MFNSIIHIHSIEKKLLLVFTFILLCLHGFSQDEYPDSVAYADTTVVKDSGYTSVADETSAKFDSLSLYDIPSFYTYEIPDSALQNLKSDEAFWYVNKVPKRQKPPELDPNKKYPEPFYLQNWFRTLLWIVIVGAFIAVLIWFLIASDVKLFRRKAAVLQSPEDIAINEDIFSINYEQELEKAIADQNYRLGVRLMYLHILRLFSEKNIIQYKIERTNSDYLLQLYNTSYYKDFFRLTRNFEYVWYGKFDISSAAFEMIRQDHTKIKSLL
jgi:hypothetical protein